ncbi:hypothetical protein ACROYT_G000342 [Oculina patagonica]
MSLTRGRQTGNGREARHILGVRTCETHNVPLAIVSGISKGGHQFYVVKGSSSVQYQTTGKPMFKGSK